MPARAALVAVVLVATAEGYSLPSIPLQQHRRCTISAPAWPVGARAITNPVSYGARSLPSMRAVREKPVREKPTAVYSLILLNFVVFVLDKLLHLPFTRSLYLYHAGWAWWQPLTSVFCHASRSHLSGNIFLLLLFGRSVEDEFGGFGLLLAFAFCGVVANLCSLLLLPSSVVSIGASGAVFGLFTVSVLSRLTLRDFDWRKLVEVTVLGEFVVGKMLSEMQTAATGGVAGVNHVAHLTGAGAGVLLVVLLDRLVTAMEDREASKALT